MSIFDDCKQISCIDAAVAIGIPLKKNNGHTAWALCPIHGERGHPSMFLSAQRGWYCYGCHRGGDAVRLYQDVLGMDPLDAAHRCADDFGIPYEGESEPTLYVSVRHLHNAIRRRRDEVRRELANKECDVDEAIQLMIHRDGMEACADNPEFYALVEKRSDLQVLMDQFLTTDDEQLLELLQDYDKEKT